jgi:hypothetical protein
MEHDRHPAILLFELAEREREKGIPGEEGEACSTGNCT